MSEFSCLSLINIGLCPARQLSYLGFSLTLSSLVYKVFKGKSKLACIIGLFYSITKVWSLGFLLMSKVINIVSIVWLVGTPGSQPSENSRNCATHSFLLTLCSIF